MIQQIVVQTQYSAVSCPIPTAVTFADAAVIIVAVISLCCHFGRNCGGFSVAARNGGAIV